MGIACADLAAAQLPVSCFSCVHWAPALARPHVTPGMGTLTNAALAFACATPPAPGWGFTGAQGATARHPTTSHLLPRTSGVRASDPGLHKDVLVASRMSSLGTLRRNVGVHALDLLLPVTLSWKPAGLSTRTPTVTSRELAKGAAEGRVGVPGKMLPARSAVTSTLPGRPLEEEPTARSVVEVVVAVCDFLLPANFKGKTATMPTVRKGKRKGRLREAVRWTMECAGVRMLRCAVGDGWGERSGAEGHALVFRAPSPPLSTLTPLATAPLHLTFTRRQPFVTFVVDVACPFSSSSVLCMPTGMLFQLLLVDALGGRAGSV